MKSRKFLAWVLVLVLVVFSIPVSYAETNDDSDNASLNVEADTQESEEDDSNEDGSNEEGSEAEGSNEEGSEAEGSNEEGSEAEGSNEEGSEAEGSNEEGSEAEGSNEEGSEAEGSDEEGSEAEGSSEEESEEEFVSVARTLVQEVNDPEDVYTLYITVDDYHTVWVNGEELTNLDRNWTTVDTHILDITDVDDLLIAVEGHDRNEKNGKGHATIAGFLATVEKTSYNNGVESKTYYMNTNKSWVQRLSIPEGDEDEWYKEGYVGRGWEEATEVSQSAINSVSWSSNVDSSEFPYESGAKWIWSEDYNDGAFDSPVFFRTEIELPANSEPVAVDDSVSADINEIVLVDVLDNDSDDDGDDLTVIEVTDADNANLVIKDNKVEVTPDKNFFGEVSFSYTVEDSFGDTATADVIVDFDGNYSNAFVVGSASQQNQTITHGVAGAIILADMQEENDTDVISNLRISKVTDSTFKYKEEVSSGRNENDAIGFLAITEGLILNNAGDVIGEAGKITIDYNDKKGTSDRSNDKKDPDWFELNNSYEFDNPIVIAQMNTLNGGNYTHVRVDASNSTELKVWLEEWSNHRKTNHHVPEEVAFMILEEGVHKVDNYVFEAQSIEGTPAYATYPFDTYFVGSPLILGQPQDYVNEGNTDNKTWITDQATLRIKNVLSGTVDLKVLEDSRANDNFVNGNNGFVAIGIKGNRPPVATDDTVSTDEDVQLIIDAAGNDTDPDRDDLSVISVGNPVTTVDDAEVVSGTTEVVDGEIVFTPAENFSGIVTFAYTVSDGGLSDEGQVTVTVTPVNDGPVAGDDTDSTDEDTPLEISFSSLLLNDSDVENDDLSITGVTKKDNGVPVINFAEDKIVFTPNINFNGTASFEYTLSDGSLTDTGLVTITVNPINDEPVAVGESVETSEDIAVSIEVLDNDSDPENDDLTPVIVDAPSNGSAVVNNDGSVTYAPNSNFNGQDSFTYKVLDPQLAESNVVTVTVDVAPVIDDLKALDDEAGVDEDASVTIDVQANDENFDNLTVFVDIVTSPENGSLTLNDDGTVTYTPNPDFNGSDTFEYRLGHGDDEVSYSSTNGTVTVDVNPIEDAPVAGDDNASVSENGSVSISVLDNDTDADGDDLSVDSIVVEPNNGSVTINEDGTITYQPNRNYDGTDSFEYKVVDGNGNEDTASVTVTVNEVSSGNNSGGNTGGTNTGGSETTDIPDGTTPLGGGDDIIFLDEEIAPLGAIEFYEPYIKGYPDGMFKPSKSVSRAEMAAIFARILKLDTEVSEEVFVDVKVDHWAAGYITAVSKLGVFNGYSDGTFRPENPISRAEFATVIAKYWAYKGINVSTAATTLIDVNGHWATEYMNQAFNAGLISGYDDNSFRPDEPTMRMHAVTMINKLIARPKYEKEVASFPDMTKHHWAYGDVEAASTFFQKETEEEGEMTLE